MTTVEVVSLPPDSPICALGFTWVILVNACLPDIARTRQRCKYGYYYHFKLRKCMRRKYNNQQKPGYIGKWMTEAPKPTRPKPTRKPKDHTDVGKMWGYNQGYNSQLANVSSINKA
ncbi:uncharacterized protein LOC108112175 [Drosophila eugracilis]|uniref:uncharacterized protein LOC108112175 n=1 Tax=Drosophila eugracilis TaxID=29029 RepID=UPI0007E87E5D|nr:uncharacterized protein LOC108112175 [Drosophila eugracilis]